MELDLRLTTLDRLEEALSLPATTISIGHEACPHKLPTLEALLEAGQAIWARGKRMAFVVPIVYERYLPAVVERIHGLAAQGPLTIVANDFGLMVLLAEQGLNQACTLAVGHALSYSFEQVPWVGLTLEQEPDFQESLWLQNSLNDPQLWPLLHEWGITEIEVDHLPQTRASFGELHTAGFTLNMLLDVVPVAYARSCHTARHYQATPPNCTHLCDSPFNLTMTHRWRLYHNQLEPMSKGARAHVPDFTVYGNVVYRHTDAAETNLPESIQRITLDLRYYSPEALQARIAELPIMAAA